MTATAVVSVAGGPGVSTLVAAIAATSTADRPLLVAEAAPSGGVVAARHEWPRTGSIVTMGDTIGPNVWDAAQPWLNGSRILAGDPSVRATRHAQLGQWLAARLPDIGVPVLIDAGRLDASNDQLALLTAVNRVWVMVDPTAAQVAAVAALAGWLAQVGNVELLVREHTTGPGRYRPADVAATTGWPVAATVPTDDRAAAVLCGHQQQPWRGLRQSALLRTGKALADRVAASTSEVAA